MREDFEPVQDDMELSGETAAEDSMAGMDFDDLASMFGDEGGELQNAEQVELTQNLEGFASCFPEWDLHPPVRK